MQSKNPNTVAVMITNTALSESMKTPNLISEQASTIIVNVFWGKRTKYWKMSHSLLKPQDFPQTSEKPLEMIQI